MSKFLIAMGVFFLGFTMMTYAIKNLWGGDVALLTVGILLSLGGLNGIRNLP